MAATVDAGTCDAGGTGRTCRYLLLRTRSCDTGRLDQTQRSNLLTMTMSGNAREQRAASPGPRAASRTPRKDANIDWFAAHSCHCRDSCTREPDYSASCTDAAPKRRGERSRRSLKSDSEEDPEGNYALNSYYLSLQQIGII